ncbi:hypothetical protein ABN028_19515 [Actinopolymorpha sp. B17G11]|uniref:hypothetical protein n=1 Tax=Actinopolymorpha sp. B17G11 TaxID=3160861 RepID=UPI0032E3945B
MAKMTLRARAEQTEADVRLIERWMPEMYRDKVAHFNVSIPLAKAIADGYVDRLTVEGRWALEELEEVLSPLAEAARGMAAEHFAKVEALKAAAADAGWIGERVLQSAAGRFAPMPGRPDPADVLAANGIDWSRACLMTS